MAKLIVPKYYPSFLPIGDYDVFVEANESKLGHRKYNKGHDIEGVWIFGFFESAIKRGIFLIESIK